MLIDEAAFGSDEFDGFDAKRLPARKDFGELASHLVVFWISMTYLLPHGHFTSEKGRKVSQLDIQSFMQITHAGLASSSRQSPG
jgi:hypothetical protein